jgi:hypothetical protein
MTFSIIIFLNHDYKFTTKWYLESPSRQGRAPSPINGVASVKRCLDLLGAASGQRDVDEKELQCWWSGSEKELRPQSTPVLTSFP